MAAVKAVLECLKGDGKARAMVYVWALEQSSSRRGWGEGDEQDVMVPWVRKGKADAKSDRGEDAGDKIFQRYYHLYRKGELDEDVEAAGGVVVESGYEKDNWWAIIRRG
jgi:tRNA (uracil-5-)-methyltransferase TRM9